MNKTIVTIIAIVLVGGLIWYVTTMKSDTNTPNTNVSTTTQNGTTGQNPPNAIMRNSIVLRETVSGNFVVVESAELTKSGYVVIYRANSNSKTDIIGHSDLLGIGAHNNLRVQLATPIAKEQNIIAVLHEDDGDKKFEFPGPDLYLGNTGARFVSDVDIVDVPFDKEPAVLNSQIELFLDRALNASTTIN